MTRKMDRILGTAFGLATVLFIILFLSNEAFFSWAFLRHQNMWSWYIRPLFIIPILYFSFRKSLTGVFASIFALFTSMFWFPVPGVIDPQATSFLAYEMEYLKGEWNAPKIASSLLVQLFFLLLILAAWKRNWKMILGVVIGAAVLKVLWSVLFSGEVGLSILKPAVLGLGVCIAAIIYFRKKRSGQKK